MRPVNTSPRYGARDVGPSPKKNILFGLTIYVIFGL